MASVKQLPNGRYQARYRDDARKEHAQNFKLKRDAQRWLDEQTAALVTSQWADPRAGVVTFAAYYDDWSGRQVWESTTRRSMDNTIKQLPFGASQMKAIRRSHIEAWVKAMTGTLAATTINTRVANVRAVFRAAVLDRVIPADPSAGVRLPRRRRAEHALTIPTPVQVRAIMSAAGDRFRPFVALCAFAGLRRGEAAAVQVSDVDFLRRTLHVRRQVQQGTGGVEFRPPKHGSERVVFLPDGLVELLSRQDSYGVDGWLFVGSNGVPPVQNTLQHHWRRTLAAAGACGIRLHDLRHYYASGLIAQGADVVTVQRALGHASAAVTLGVYSHLWPTAEDRTRQAASALWSEALADDLRTVGVPTAI